MRTRPGPRLAAKLAAVAWVVAITVALASAAPAWGAGPVMVSDINPGAGDSSPAALTNVNGTLFFAASDGTHGVELWKSDGTAAGTVMVKDINPSGDSNPESLVNVGGTLFFSADDGTHGRELWKSDGTDAGTVMVSDINPGSAPSDPFWLTDVGGELLFSANDGTHGDELWKSDGSADGTGMVKDIYPGASSNPTDLVDVDGTLFFHATENVHGDELWRSDGTSDGTTLVDDINPGTASSSISELTNVNGTLFFAAFDGTRHALWKSDGTATGTTEVKFVGSVPSNLTSASGTLFFAADDTTHGLELWKSDGTATGTAMVKDINPGPGSSNPGRLGSIDFNGTLFFGADDGTDGVELWKSDGTASGTTLVKDINPGSGDSNPGRFASSGGQVYFSADDGMHGVELWKTDGTGGGTMMVADINPGPSSSFAGQFADVNGTLFFSADDGTHGLELWDLAAGGPPTATTGQATSISDNGATLNGTVNPNGAQITDCHFEIGTTTSYGTSVLCSELPGAGTSLVAVSAQASGLAANTTYDYRLVASGAGGTSNGDNRTFTTGSTVTTSQTAGVHQGASITIQPGSTGETDTATVAARAAPVGGTVTFSLYSSRQCTPDTLMFDGGTKSITTDDPSATSDPVTQALSDGTYYWVAAYSGNSVNPPGTSPCGAEALTIGKSTTTLRMFQSWESEQGIGPAITIPRGAMGESIEASLLGENVGVARGTMTFGLYSDPACTHQVFTTTKDVSGVIVQSDPVTRQLSLGTYYWTAAYSGDSRNQSSTTSCGAATLTVAVLPPAPTTLSTYQVLGAAAYSQAIPRGANDLHDHANVFGANASVASGSVTFGLYSDSSCDQQVFFSTNPVRFGAGSGTPDYAQADSNVVPRNLLSGILYWRAIYSGDSQNQPSTSPCSAVNLAPNRIPVDLDTVNYQVWGSESGTSITVPWWASGVLDRTVVYAVPPSPDVPPPTGTAEFFLFPNAQCTHPVFHSSFQLTNTLTTSSPVGQLAPGTYYWRTIYNGDISYLFGGTTCGAERLTVTSPISGPAFSTATAVTLPLTCPVAVCRLRITMTVRAPALVIDARNAGKRNPPVITLARGAVTIRKHGPQRATLRLTGAGRRYIASHHGRVSVTATIATTVNGHTRTLKRPLTLKIAERSGRSRAPRSARAVRG